MILVQEIWRELRGSQGIGAVSDNRFDRVLLPICLHLQTLMLTDAQTPFLGTPLVPLKRGLDEEILEYTRVLGCGIIYCIIPQHIDHTITLI